MISRMKLLSLLLGGVALGLLGVTTVNSQIVTGTQDFSITVESANVPAPFSFPPTTVYTGEVAETSPVLLTGFTGPLPITVSGTGSPEYSLDGGVTFTSAEGVVNEGDSLILRVAASTTAGQSRSGTVTIGGQGTTLTVSASAHPSSSILQLSNVYTNAPLSTLYSSREIDRFVTVPLANTPISISGGAEYRVGAGAWTTAPSVLPAGTSEVRVRMLSASTYETTRVGTLRIGPLTRTLTVTTTFNPAEYNPNPFNLASITVAPGTVAEEVVTISGLGEGREPFLRVSGSTAGRNAVFSVNGDAFSGTQRRVKNGDVVTFRINAAPNNLGVSQLVAETLDPSGTVASTDTWSVTTDDPNAVDAFSFNWTHGEAPATRTSMTTNTVTLTGGSGFQKASFLGRSGYITGRDCLPAMQQGDMTMPLITSHQPNEGPRLVSSGAFRTNGTSVSGDVWSCHLDAVDIGVYPGATIGVWSYPDGGILRGQIYDQYAALCIGSTCAEVRHTWHPVGSPTDPRAADPFTIAARTDLPLGQTDVTSDPFTVSWSPLTPGYIPPNIPISISGAGSPEYRVNGGSWTSAAGWVSAGSTVEVRLDAASTHITTRTATLSVGTTTAPFSVTTIHDTIPDAFSFVSSVSTNPNGLFTSLPVSITGITTSVPISVSGDGSPQFSTDGGNTWRTSGTVANNGSVLLRLTSSPTIGEVRTATLDVNGVTGTWSVETSEPLPIDLVATFSAVNNTPGVVPAYQAGDLFVAFAWANERYGPVPSNATGWTQLGSLSTGSNFSGRAAVAAYWVAPTSCAASCTLPTGNFGSITDRTFYAIYRNAGTPVITTSSGGSRSLTYPANSASPDNARTLVFVGINNTGLTPTPPSGMTVAQSLSNSTVGGTIRMFERDIGPAFTGGSFSWSLVSADWLSFTVRIPRK